MYELLPQTKNDVLGVRVSGTVTGDDYERFRPVLDEAVRQHGTVRLLIWMDDFDGWGDLDAAWEDLKLDASHYTDVGRPAMVGDERWQAWVTKATDLLAPGDVRYMDEADLAEAWAWVRKGDAPPSCPPKT
jgi:hypothetical protein